MPHPSTRAGAISVSDAACAACPSSPAAAFARKLQAGARDARLLPDMLAAKLGHVEAVLALAAVVPHAARALPASPDPLAVATLAAATGGGRRRRNSQTVGCSSGGDRVGAGRLGGGAVEAGLCCCCSLLLLLLLLLLPVLQPLQSLDQFSLAGRGQRRLHDIC